MRMKFSRSSQRSQNQSGTIAEPQELSRRDQQGAEALKAAKNGYIHSGFALVLVAAASLLVASLITACETLTVDFVYVASAKAAGTNNYGEIDVFEINSESGKMRQIPTSPFPSGGRDPVAEAISADNENLFVANQDDNTIVQFAIGIDGKLYPNYTVNTPGIYPLAIAANKSNVFVVDTYQPLPQCSTADPCSGSIAVFPLTAGNSSTCSTSVCLGPAATNSAIGWQYWPLLLSGANSSHVIVPTAVNVLKSGSYVYVTTYDSSVSPTVGYIFAFWVVPSGTSSTSPATIPSGITCPAPTAGGTPTSVTTIDSPGTLCPLNSPPFAAGVQPSAIASDSTSAYVYVTDYASSNVRGYTVGSSGALTALSGSPFQAGNQPTAVVVDPSYPYAYVANYTDDTVTAYSISGGVLTRIGSYATGLQPVAMGIDPSTNHFLYTANFLANTVSGFELSTTDGTLLDSQFSPYTTNAQPVAVAAIPHNGVGGGVQQ
jgi:6-phosphogluconolactonase (cycloisomerase 2 family)